MPVSPTYPGVYVEEIPSAVHPIIGVSTSVTAFIGTAPSGVIGRAVECLNFGDYVKNFGGLDPTSEMGYAVNQFFLNGGTDAFIIRVAANPKPASTNLTAGALGAVLQVTSQIQGDSANLISVTIGTREIQDGLFDLIVNYTDPNNSDANVPESFPGLSMDPTSETYVVSVVNDEDNGSSLIKITDLVAADPNLQKKVTNAAVVTSAALTYSDATNKLQVYNASGLLPTDGSDLTVVVNGTLVTINSIVPSTGFTAGAAATANLASVCATIQSAVRQVGSTMPAASNAALVNFTCAPDATKPGVISMKAGAGGYTSEIVVSGSAARTLMLGSSYGGQTIPGVAQLNPIGPAGGGSQSLAGGSETALDPNSNPDAFIPAYVGDPDQNTGMYCLNKVDLFNIVCIPGITDSSYPFAPAILAAAAAYCEKKRAFLIIDSPKPAPGIEYPPAQMKTAGSTSPMYPKSDHAAVYYPWVKIPDPLQGGRSRISAPCGTIAGIYARTDVARGVWKAPAGIEATLTGVVGLNYRMTDDENGLLNPLGVNCLRTFPVYGNIVWGARTLRGADVFGSDYKYVPVRRFANYLEESLFRGLKWVVFEPNDEPLWSAIRLNVGAFMHDLFIQGAFEGSSPRDAYRVQCDATTTTQNDIDKGIVNIIVAFAPLKPAEFVILQIQQMAGQILT